jgi:hypothetical protein
VKVERMIEGLPGLIAIGGVATVGFLMIRAFNGRRGTKGSHDYASGGPAAVDGPGWFGGLFGSSDHSSSPSDSNSGGGDSGAGGGDGGGGGGGD